MIEHRVWFVSHDIAPLVAKGLVQYAPLSIGDVPGLIASGRFEVDVAVVQVSEPNAAGVCTLGVTADLGQAMMRNARTVIGEINPAMPRTRGDTQVLFEDFDAFVEGEGRMLEYQPQEDLGPTAGEIARYVARLVPDGATLQIAGGGIPAEVLRYLGSHRDLGIHSDLITDAVVELVESGVVTNRRKATSRGRVVTSLAMGTGVLYDAIDDNRRYDFRPIEQVADMRLIEAQHRMVSITQGTAIDLTGQVSTESRKGRLYAGVGNIPHFHIAAARSSGGRAIVCLPSREHDGDSNIRAVLRPEEAVTLPRFEAHWVVTEFGTAYLYGATRRQRAVALIEIAHPDDRDGLLAEAKQLGLLPEAQTLRSRRDYPVEEERDIVIDKAPVTIRPTRTTDAGKLQALFYDLDPEDVRTRFFRHLSSLTKQAAEHLCSVSYGREMAFAAVVGDAETEQVVATSSYYVDPQTRLADVGYMVHPDWQGKGLGSRLHEITVDYAARHGVRGFTADVLEENLGMLAVLAKGPGHMTRHTYGGVTEVTIIFGATSATASAPEGDSASAEVADDEDPVGPPRQTVDR